VVSDRPVRVAITALVAGATAVVLVALAVVPFLNPAWVAFEQQRAEAAAWTGFTPAELRTATDAILADLVLGPPDFDAEVRGAPVLTERERGHMRDVRGVFGGLAVVALVAALGIVLAWRISRGARAFWRGVRAGAAALAVGVLAIGIVGLVAFDLAFELFHRLLFAGNYTFDPATERLVQLFPQRFWFDTSIAVGIVVLVLSGTAAWLATRRLRADARPAVVHAASLEAAR
jgi:integral membrane protein (TIGR01906 family)